MQESKKERIKRETLELYRSLPQDEASRKSRLDVRDKVIELNYEFFGWVASHTFINNTSVTYEDKLQSALLHFCECWWWYGYSARYRTDLSFTVFFKPRISEMIERELNEVKYSVRRSLCMEAGKQIGKHWGQVKYDDLKEVSLPADKMNSLKAIFGTMYWADIETYEPFLQATEPICSMEETLLSDRYDTVDELLIHEMVEQESLLDDKHLRHMAKIYEGLYPVTYEILRDRYPEAVKQLYNILKQNMDAYDEFL